jgi:DNA phosphorothioation-dependent restriction protein DptH
VIDCRLPLDGDQAMSDLEVVDLLEGLSIAQMDASLWDSTTNLNTGLIASYRAWLDATVTAGYYSARAERLPALLTAFDGLAAKVLDGNLLGGNELLRRLYKAFLLVDERAHANDPYLPAAIVWGLSPAVLELTQARVRFLANGFPEAVGELALGRQGKVAFERLLDLAQIHRPLAALVVGPNGHLSASIKSFGLLHYLGSEPSADKSLAVQALLRDEESDDDEDVSDIVHSCEEQELVTRVLDDYQQLYPFAEDGLRILAVNVRDLRTILAGVDHFLEGYLKRTSADWPAFHCTVMVYSTSSSPMAMEKRLTLWRNHVVEFQREKGRQLILSVGHRYAPKQQVIDLLKQEKRSYDIAFLFHFLRSELVGRAIAASPFEFNFDGWGGVQFPIAEYPRPTQQGDRYRRQSLLSNRRLRIQTRHADLSAKLCYDGSAGRDHLIIGQVDYEPWASVVETLHQRAQWVACVDPFVDKRLLSSERQSANAQDRRLYLRTRRLWRAESDHFHRAGHTQATDRSGGRQTERVVALGPVGRVRGDGGAGGRRGGGDHRSVIAASGGRRGRAYPRGRWIRRHSSRAGSPARSDVAIVAGGFAAALVCW